MSFNPGENVGPYRIIEQLGQGGMASVLKAYHPALDRYVALKVLHPAFLEDPNFLARFQREARVVAKLEHPNIVPVYDFSEHAGQPFLVMKYIKGRTLKSLLAEGPLDKQLGLRIVEAVGEGLGYAHERGILHRDIKPSNVLLDGEGGIFLADFGLARIAQAGESTLSSDMLLGTPQYISPEQARGEKDLDEGTDIYSLGVVVYEMVVGRVPFNADTPFSIIHDHIYTPLPMPRQINSKVPERIERVLLKALAKNREDRFESVQGMVQAFRGALVEEKDTVPLDAVPPANVRGSSPSETEKPPERRRPARRWLWIGGGVVLACLCLFSFLAIANNRDGQGQSEVGTATAVALADTIQPSLKPPPTEVMDNPRVLAARATVAADPDNPESQMELARRFVEAGFPRRAVPPLLIAAELYSREGAWTEAARILVEAISFAGGPYQVDDRVREQATEALFMSATSPDQTAPLLDRFWEEYPDWDVLLPLSARTAMYAGDLDPSVEALEVELEGRPEDVLIKSVLAEGYLLQGRLKDAGEIAQQASDGLRGPPWLVEHLRRLISRIESS
jgi:serine/threonine protein kinase